MTMNPTMNHLNKTYLMDENEKYTGADKAPAMQTGGAMHGDSGIGGKGGIGTAVPQRGGTMPIFIDIENLDLTVICGNQENYHENINGGLGCMHGGQQRGCGGDDCFDEGCDCYDDGCYDESFDDDDFDEPIAPVDTEAPCNTCDFSVECLKRSIESGDNIFLDQIIRKMAYIAGIPLGTAMKAFDAYLTLCSIFDEEPPVRFKKRKYDVHRIPVGLDDLTNRIHKAATSLAYGLTDSESMCAEEKAEKDMRPQNGIQPQCSAQPQHNTQPHHSVQPQHGTQPSRSVHPQHSTHRPHRIQLQNNIQPQHSTQSQNGTQPQQDTNRSRMNNASASQGERSVEEEKPNVESVQEAMLAEVLDALPEPVRAILRDAPDELKSIVRRACEKGKELYIIHINVKGDAEDGSDTAEGQGAEAQGADSQNSSGSRKSPDSDNSPENIIPMT